MNKMDNMNDYGKLVEPATLKIERRLPGSLERVWSYLTDGELRRQWLAAGDMTLEAGSTFELVWRNDELTDPPGEKPEGFSCEHRMESRILEVNPPHRLVFTWGESGEVSFDLKEDDGKVLLTIIHQRISDRNMSLMVGAGWHMHLNILRSKLSGETPEPFWDGWTRLKAEYDGRFA